MPSCRITESASLQIDTPTEPIAGVNKDPLAKYPSAEMVISIKNSACSKALFVDYNAQAANKPPTITTNAIAVSANFEVEVGNIANRGSAGISPNR